MAIQWVDNPGQVATIASTLDALTGSLSGTFVAPGNVTGLMQTSLQPVTANFDGLFQGDFERTGTIATTLSGVGAAFFGSPGSQTTYNVHPISIAAPGDDDGMFENDDYLTDDGTPTGTPLNPGATYFITTIDLRGAILTPFTGGAFTLDTTAATPGVASWNYTVIDYDGLGTNATRSVTVTIT